MRRIAWLCGALSCLTVLGCGRRPAGLAPSDPPEVVVSHPVVKQVTEYEDFIGDLTSMADVTVRARVTGYLDRVNFKEGTEVKEGDLLFEIDPRPYQATLNQTKATVLQDKALLERLKSSFSRVEKLLPQHAISQDDYDTIKGDRDAAIATVKSAESARDLAELNLSFTKVRAPISGRISNQKIDPGNMVQADQTALTTIVAVDPIYAYFDVPDRIALRIRRLIRAGVIKSAFEAKMPVFLGLPDEGDRFPHEGVVNFVDNRVEGESGTLRVRGVFPNPDRILSPGLWARIRLPIGKQHPAILISQQALGSDQGQPFVYVVNDQNDVVVRPVKTGLLQDGLCVIETGLTQDDRVIVNGLQRVRPGVKVKLKPAATPAATTATSSPAAAPNAKAANRPSS